MLDPDELLRKALVLPAQERRHLARELLKSLDGAEGPRVPPHPAIPDEGLLMRHSSIAYAVVKLRIGDSDCVLLNYHRQWDDWTFPGGHVEPSDADFHAAATREAAEELAPLRPGEDFEIALEPLARPKLGPVLSPVQWGVATTYHMAFYLLQFKNDPRTSLARLPPGEFRFTAISDLVTASDVSKLLNLFPRELTDGWSSVPLSWSGALDVDPLRA